MVKVIAGWLLGMLLAGSALAQTADVPPDVLVKRVTDEVLATIRSDPELQAGNQKKITELAEAKILPHFDFARMTRLAVGAPWRQATPTQQQTLIDEFRTLLVRTYTTAFTQYRDQTIDYRPLKIAATDNEAVVRLLVKQSGGGDPIDINYSMEKTDKGWKVYDVVIAGVSLVQNYRSSFQAEIQRGGLDGLIASLSAKNKSPAPPPAAAKK